MFSSNNGDKSSSRSDFIVNRIVNIVESISNKQLNQDQIDTYITYPVRKGAHITEYLILGVLVFLLLSEYKVNKKVIICLFICIMYASLDEIHQLFIDNRTGKITDVLIDTFGILIGVLITNKTIKNNKNKNQNF